MKLHHHHQPGHDALSEINIIPFVDVILVLLIVFMVAAPLLQQGIDVDLPEVDANAVASASEDFIVSVDKNGKIFLGKDKKTPYSLQSLQEKLSTIFENKKKKEIYLRAAKDIEYGYIVRVMAISQDAGIERIGMITVPAQKGK